MTAKKNTKRTATRPAPLDPSRVATQYLSNEEWADAFEQALTELATERAAQVARVTAFLQRTRPDAEPEEVEPPRFRGRQVHPDVQAGRFAPAPVSASPGAPRDITLEAILDWLASHQEPQTAGRIAKGLGYDKAADAPGLSEILKRAVAENVLQASGVRRGVTYRVA